jgi:hypothetical protein
MRPAVETLQEDSTRGILSRPRTRSRDEELDALRNHARGLEDDVRRLIERVTDLEARSGKGERGE